MLYNNLSYVCQRHDFNARLVIGSIRLVDGYSFSDGRLEIYYNGTWGTVCDDHFNVVAATVACQQLGYRLIYIYFKTIYQELIWTNQEKEVN